jgi:glycosyltransferase involved in cell wall biosynthesis
MKKVPGRVVSRRVSFPLTGLLSRWKYKRLPGRIIAVSSAIRDGLLEEGLPDEMVQVVHSGYDPDRFADLPSRAECRRRLRWPAGALVTLFVGALAPHKSIPTLLEAFQKVVKEMHRDTLRLMIAGDGPLRPHIEERVRERRLEPYVELLGFRDDVPHLMMAADVVVLPSAEGEGSPAVIKEAMVCGRAVVAASHGGVDEIIEHDETGLLVPPGGVSSLAGALLRVLRDEDLRDALGERAKGVVSKFGVRRMVEETERIYRELVGSG